MVKYLLLLIILVFGSGQNVFSQSEKKSKEELYKIAFSNQADTVRLRALSDLCDIADLHEDLDRMKLAQLSKEIAEKNLAKKKSPSEEKLFLKWLSLADHNIGACYWRLSKTDSALYYLNLAIEESERGGYERSAFLSRMTMANVQLEHGEIDGALINYRSVLEYCMKERDSIGLAYSYDAIGQIYYDLGNIPLSLDYYNKAIRIGEMLNDPTPRATSYNNIGRVYTFQKDYEKANEFYNKCLKILLETNNQVGLIYVYNNLGFVLERSGSVHEAMEYYRLALGISRSIENKNGEGLVLKNIGNVYSNQEELDSSEVYFSNALALSYETGNVSAQAQALSNLASIHIKRKNYSQAKKFALEAHEIGVKIGHVAIIEGSSSNLYKIYESIGDYQQALKFHKEYITMRDSIINQENSKASLNSQFQYEYQKKTEQDSIKTAEAKRVYDAQLMNKELENQKQRQQQIFLYGGLILAIIFGLIMFNRFRFIRKQKMIIEDQKLRVEEQKEKLDESFLELEQKNEEILDSITYAQRIQKAILPPRKVLDDELPEHFVFYKPKDIVAGDFYWFEKVTEGVFLAVADCTGHGVPGAMVSVVCNNSLNRSVREFGLSDPGKVLDKSREIVIAEFERSEDEVKDGMDIALVHLQNNKLKYSGAHNPLWLIRKGASEIEEIKADKQPIGSFYAQTSFKTHALDLQEGDTFFLFSDGYADQFGGDKGKKFKAKNLKELLLSMKDKSMKEQSDLISDHFDRWKGTFEQLDDVCILGVRV